MKGGTSIGVDFINQLFLSTLFALMENTLNCGEIATLGLLDERLAHFFGLLTVHR